MTREKFWKQRGLAQGIVLIVMVFMAVALPVATNLAKKNQENRSKAAEGDIYSCSMLYSLNRDNFRMCKENGFEDICFNKFTHEYQGCVSNGRNDCTENNKNSDKNMICTVDGLVVPTVSSSPRKYVEGKHIILDLDKEHAGVITDSNLKLWLSKLDSEYEVLADLTGRVPYDGRKITIKEYKCNQDGYGNEKYACMYWAWAGEVTGWAGGQVESELKKINDTGDWSFGILHEISHSFDTDGWNFDPELMANFKMAYFLEKSGGKVWQNNRFYTGSEIKDFYKISSTWGYDDVLKSGNYASDFMAYKLLDIKDNIGGWNTYMRVFKNLSGRGYSSDSKKLVAFLTELASVSKVNVGKMFTSEERKIIENKFGKVFAPKCGFSDKKYTEAPNKDTMCEVGIPSSGKVNRTTMIYFWNCTVLNETKGCSASPVKGGLVNGKCGNSRNVCTLGTFSVMSSSSVEYRWRCVGKNGGKTVACSIKK